MKSFEFNRRGTGVAAALGLLATTVVAPAQATSENVLYSFMGTPAGDGANPSSGLTDVGGTLYGTTAAGGAGGYGTVFKLTKSGIETVLYAFQGSSASDGAAPVARLINVDGTLYGTTVNGGATNFGTVFAVTLAGSEKVLHAFAANGVDGFYPESALIKGGSDLYGTCSAGGANDAGTVFKITKTGIERVLYSFGTAANDGARPFASLVKVGGALYGTTYEGGASGAGTVFAVTRAGAEKVLYSFKGVDAGDGQSPAAGLTNLGGTLYGTTVVGGDGDGIVFKVTPTGAESVLYTFKGSSDGDGATPYDGLINVGGTFYGTTENGGTGNYGTVFTVTPTGAETVVYSFQGPSSGDGAYPAAGLIRVGHTLYGTTKEGGAGGYGTVFSITP